jgi:hypothetical protein
MKFGKGYVFSTSLLGPFEECQVRIFCRLYCHCALSWYWKCMSIPGILIL